MKFQLSCLGLALVSFAMSIDTLSSNSESTLAFGASYVCAFVVGVTSQIVFSYWWFGKVGKKSS